MEKLLDLDIDFLNPYLIPFNQEIDSLADTLSSKTVSVDDKFYTSISNGNDTFSVLAPNMVKEKNDYVFHKDHVNPYFVQKNNISTLLQALRNEEIIQTTHFDDDNDNFFSDVKRKMQNFLAVQNTMREHAKIDRIKHAILEHRWTYSPKLISPFLKTFVHECMMTETVMEQFQETVKNNAIEISSDSSMMNDCVFGFTLERFLDNKDKRNMFIRLFLPAVYKLPKQVNPGFAFTKYILKLFPNNVEIDNGEDTIHSLLYNVSKYNNIDKTQTVSNFVKCCTPYLKQTYDGLSEIEIVERRAKLVQIYSVLLLIIKSRFDQIKVKRAERGKLQSTTKEFIFKANTLYFDERNNTWCIYMHKFERPIFSNNILDMFFYLLSS